jgi:hypothetical protein
LSEPRVAANQKWKNACGHWIQSTEMTDRTFSGDSAQSRHNVVARHSAWLVNDQKSVHLITLLHPGQRLTT